MKKSIVFGLLIALACFLLYGCTPKEAENSSSDVNLPTLNTEHEVLPDDTADSETGSQKPEPSAPQLETETDSGMESQTPSEDVTEPVTVSGDSEDPTEDPAIVSEENPDDEVVSEFVVDGGDEFGFGGN